MGSGRTLRWVLLGVSLVLVRSHAVACGCVDWPPERRLAEAERIFIGRTASHPTEQAIDFVQFTVLETLKGSPTDHFDLKRVSDDCERSFQRGELALVFVVKGHAPTCAGNVDLEQLMPTLGEYLGGDQTPSTEALKLALTGRVKGAKATVYAPALAGKTLQVGSTKVSFVHSGKTDELLTVGGTTRGSLTYVALRAPDQVATYLLLGREKGRLAILSELKRDLKIK